jgi:hypothetical protein
LGLAEGVQNSYAPAGTVRGTEALAATMTLHIAGLQLEVKFDGEIQLQ